MDLWFLFIGFFGAPLVLTFVDENRNAVIEALSCLAYVYGSYVEFIHIFGDPSWYGIDEAEVESRRRWTSNTRSQVSKSFK